MTHALAPTLSIGQIVLDAPIVQAALSGYSDRAMRVLARRHGAAYTIGEVLLDKFVVEAGASRRNRNRLSVDPEEHPVGGQLMGADPEQFPPAAVKLVEAGFDVIDINFGCPVKKVLGRCRGGFLLGVPETALEIVSRVREAVPAAIPVTLKMRRGIDDSAASTDKFWQIFEGAFAAGVAAITVHGRSVRQRYDGPSSWDFLREVKQAAGSRTIIGSGDLFSASACLAMLEQTGVDGVSIARGAIGNPWIFEGLRCLLAGQPLPAPPSLFAQADMLREHYGLAEELHGEELTCRVMRKFAIKYARLHPEHLSARDAFVRVKTRADWMTVLALLYADDLPGRVPDDDIDETASCF
ncbi:MAG: tRNA-dihydrouridine synthase [Planctomycetota bacterium]|nr:tRNA-dihydrouridine synthase [Planctomycetota bacterium]